MGNRPLPKKVETGLAKLTIPDPKPEHALSDFVWVDGYSSKQSYLVVARSKAVPARFISARDMGNHIRVHVHPSLDWLELDAPARAILQGVLHRPRHGYTRIWIKPGEFLNQLEKWQNTRGLFVLPFSKIKSSLGNKDLAI